MTSVNQVYAGPSQAVTWGDNCDARWSGLSPIAPKGHTHRTPLRLCIRHAFKAVSTPVISSNQPVVLESNDNIPARAGMAARAIFGWRSKKRSEVPSNGTQVPRFELLLASEVIPSILLPAGLIVH